MSFQHSHLFFCVEVLTDFFQVLSAAIALIEEKCEDYVFTRHLSVPLLAFLTFQEYISYVFLKLYFFFPCCFQCTAVRSTTCHEDGDCACLNHHNSPLICNYLLKCKEKSFWDFIWRKLPVSQLLYATTERYQSKKSLSFFLTVHLRERLSSAYIGIFGENISANVWNVQCELQLQNDV